MNKYLEEAEAIRKSINGLAEGASDEKIVNNKDAFPWWNGNGVFYKAGLILRFADSVYKTLQDHTSQNDWAPDVAVSLFAKVLAGDEIEVWEQPDSTNGYMTGDKVYFPTKNDNIYESLIDNNIWSPAAYPAGWKKL